MALSYAEIRDLVSDQLGTCSVTTEELEANLLGVLEDVKNRIGNDASKNTRVPLSVIKGQGSYVVPSTVDRISSITNADGHELFRVAYPCSYCSTNTETGTPTSWHMDVTDLLLHPIPNAAATYTIRGTKKRDYVLYDVGVDNLKIWRIVDLPTGLHYAYAEAVLAQSIMKEDPGRAAVFSASAMDKIANWKRDQTASQGNAQRPLRFGSDGMSSYTWGQSGRSNWRARNYSVTVPPATGTTMTLTQQLIEWTLAQAWRIVSATYDVNGAMTSASIVWPDGVAGTFVGTPSITQPSALDAFIATHGFLTVSQPPITRNGAGRVLSQPALIVA